MASLPWVKVATDFADDPKSVALASRLADPRAALHLPPMWGHFARHYADGAMPDTEDAIRALERSALWFGEPGALVAAMLDVGLLERRRKRIAVHNWREWQDGHARKLERDRARMRAKRADSREMSRATVERPSRDGRAIEERERRGRVDKEALSGAGAPGLRVVEEPKSPADPSPARPPLPVPTPEDLQQAWNELAPAACPRWAKMPEARRRAARSRIAEHLGDEGGPLAWWRRVLALVAASPFLRGERGDWRADPDWLLKPANVAKVEEGKYADRAAAPSSESGVPMDERRPAAEVRPPADLEPLAPDAWERATAALARDEYAARWLAKVSCLGRRGDEVWCQAPDKFCRDFIEDQFRGDLERALGPGVTLRLVAQVAHQAMAGAAP